ncbi:very late factor 1, bracovirus capsid protein [Microplitis demolitor]|uniref:very late factor 1, bracovirus capsid protein n=1 Tax=Microplitis demolitor TaxID=69319 RepID=UPI00043FFF9A|nr:very late factor 1, bracovirus capsid protein [Microplitis demolitor]KAG6558456.1 very late factor 1, bracovirus capsid protein [Microplitis demolitor]
MNHDSNAKMLMPDPEPICLNVDQNPYVNELIYHKSTLKTHNAHLKKLKDLNIDPLSLTDKTISDKLMDIKKSGSNGKELSIHYINGIYATIKRIQPSLTKSRRDLGLRSKNSGKSTKRSTDVFIGTKNLLTTIVRDVKRLNTVESYKADPRRIIDTKIAIVLTLLTNLRSSELLQLRVKHIDLIKRELPLSIRTKHRNTSIKILKMAKLFDVLYPKVIKMALSRDGLYTKSLDTDFETQIKNNPVIQNTLLVSCKVDTINKVMRQIYENVNGMQPSVALGLKSIRSLNTTIMINHKELLLAQTLNRHKDVNVTLKHYNCSSFEEKIAGAY